MKPTLKYPRNLSIIPTANVFVRSPKLQYHRARAILDSGSETNIITTACAKRCNLAVQPCSGLLAGIGGTKSTQIIGTTAAYVYQNNTLPDLIVSFIVLHNVTLDLPSIELPHSNWPHLNSLKLADPSFYSPGPIDIIFGSDIMDQVDCHEMIYSIAGSPNARLTTFGWVISGPLCPQNKKNVSFHHSKISRQVYSSEDLKNVPPPKEKRTEGPGYRFRSCEMSINKEYDSKYPASKSYQEFVSVKANLITRKIFLESCVTHHLKEALSSSKCWPTPTSIKLCTQTRVDQAIATAVTTSGARKASASDPEYARLLEKMFKLENVEEVSPMSPNELKAEDIFRKACYRKENGRFVVGLPLDRDPMILGSTRHIAIRRLYQLEDRHRKNPLQQNAYHKFMEEYLTLGHMEPVPPPTANLVTYYLPHHAVHRPSDPPDKIRVVFNASQRSSSGISLNDILLPGPRLQLDISDVVTRFRFDPFVFMADIRQMFRQIEHRPQDQDLLRIVWRPSPDQPIQDYRLKTVTYGTASAPYLACKVLQELAQENQNKYPAASLLLKTRTYVDDINGGGKTLSEALAVRCQLQDLLSTAQLDLRKWASNEPRLLEGIPQDHILPVASSISFDDEKDSFLKLLGLCWNPNLDCFHYQPTPICEILTKRELASQIAKVFDPLGWLAPITIFARSIFRTIVQNSFGWDDRLPSGVIRDWNELARELPLLETLQIPRLIPSTDSSSFLVGFADASERAYAAVVYWVCLCPNNQRPVIRLITSKARVSPIKPETLPRLELCAAQLLGRTLKRVAPLFPDLDPSHVLAFSDSSVALSWITAEPTPVWKVFVGNRVSDILKHVPKNQWFHVTSENNPADCASRGMRPSDLLQTALWWNGPKWLSDNPHKWPLRRVRPQLEQDVVKKEIRPSSFHVGVTAMAGLSEVLENHFSHYVRLQSVIAWCLRFQHNASHPIARRKGPLSAVERRAADRVLILRAQAQALHSEILDSQQERPKLQITKVLNLFLDHDRILRVGGRLARSSLPELTKHPALLPSDHPTTKLIVRWFHQQNLHVGPTTTLAMIRSKYWIVNGKNVVRRLLQQCVICRRSNPRPFQPVMGNLPPERMTQVVPFNVTGVDCAGPFRIKAYSTRNAPIVETLLAIFVCMSTKAVHLEVVEDKSANAFLMAYHSFISRRGRPAEVWSDNGTNFVGAANEMAKIQRLLQQEASLQETEWRFIPPRAPHFGGLWEAAVKSAKRILHTVLREQTPNMMVFRVLVTRIEAVLNSRPLTAMSSSPNDLAVLTPGHFLVHRPLTAPPIHPDVDLRTSLRNKWLWSQHALKSFWQRWQREYLLETQGRQKWNQPSDPAKIDDVVVLIEDNLPPFKWKIGRITKLYPGQDGVPRVADIRTEDSNFQRPVRKLCPLPIRPDNEEGSQVRRPLTGRGGCSASANIGFTGGDEAALQLR